MIKNVVSDSTPWVLGSLDEGWECIAFTFQEQLPIELNEAEMNTLLEASDKAAQTAYKRMDLSHLHKWTMNTDSEVQFIIRECNLQENDFLIDFGCGSGRHSIKLAQNGINVTAVDYIDTNIIAANKAKLAYGCNNVNFSKRNIG